MQKTVESIPLSKDFFVTEDVTTINELLLASGYELKESRAFTTLYSKELPEQHSYLKMEVTSLNMVNAEYSRLDGPWITSKLVAAPKTQEEFNTFEEDFLTKVEMFK